MSDPLAELADEFLEQCRNGQEPSVCSFADAHPEHADAIRELFPTLAMLEQCTGEPTVGGARASDRSLAVAQRVAADDSADPAADASATAAPPRRIGKYRVIREIGRGGMGVVYEAEHESMQRRVALKLLNQPGTRDEATLQRFLRETRVAGQLHHTNIVPIFEVGCDGEQHYFAMQFIRGENLETVVARLRRMGVGTDLATIISNSDTQAGLRDSFESLADTLAHSLISQDWSASALRTDSAIDRDFASNELSLSSTLVPLPPESSSSSDAWLAHAGNTVADQGDVNSASGEARRVDAGGRSAPETLPRRPRAAYDEQVARLGLQVADALQYAHQHGFIHRDIKPANLILDTEGTLWIGDFGLARHEEDNLTQNGALAGTLRYMAPERFRGQVDARGDIYGLGLTLYELSVLRPAFEDTERGALLHSILEGRVAAPRSLAPGLSRDLETIILKAIARDPGTRYSTAAQLGDDLRRFLNDRPITARRVSHLERAWRWCRRNRVLATSFASILVLLLVILAVTWHSSAQARKQARLLAQENVRTERAKREAEAAHAVARQRLFETYVGRAQAGRFSGRPGQHYRSLEAISQAALLLPELSLAVDESERYRLLLRNEAIAAIPLMDLSPMRVWQFERPWTDTVAFDSSYEHFAQADETGRVRVRTVRDEQLVADFPGKDAPAWLLKFSRDGRYLVGKFYQENPSPSRPQIRVWDVHKQELILEFTEQLYKAPVVFSPDSRNLALALETGAVQIFNLAERHLERQRTFAKEPFALAFSADSRTLAVGVWSEIELWNTETNASQRINADEIVITLSWSPNGQWIAAGTDKGSIVLWEADDPSRAPRQIAAHRNHVGRLIFNHAGDRLASYGWDSTVHLWNVTTLHRELSFDAMRLTDTGFRADDRALALVGPGDQFGIWNVSSESPLHHVQSDPHLAERWIARFHPTNPRVLVSGTHQGIEVWDAVGCVQIGEQRMRRVRSVCFTGDGHRMVTSGDDGVALWELTLQEEADGLIATLNNIEWIKRASAHRCDIDAQGRFLITQTRGHTATIHDLHGELPDRNLGQHPLMDRVLISRDGRLAVTSTWHGRGVRIWDVRTGELLKDPMPEASSAAVAFSHDGQHLAVSLGDRQCLWNTNSWSLELSLPRERSDGWPGPISFSRDGRQLFVPKSRFTPQLVRIRDGRTLAVFEPPFQSSLSSYDVSSDGRFLAIAQEQLLQLWDLRQLRNRLAAMHLDWEDHD